MTAAMGRGGQPRLFSFADLQQSCREAGAPDVAETPAGLRLVEMVAGALRLKNAMLAPPVSAIVMRDKRLRAAWVVLEKHLSRSRAGAELVHRGEWRNETLRAQHADHIARLAELDRAMRSAKRDLLPGESRSRGQHGAPARPRKMDLQHVAAGLREAWRESGVEAPPEAAVHRVIAQLFAMSPDAVRKALDGTKGRRAK